MYWGLTAAALIYQEDKRNNEQRGRDEIHKRVLRRKILSVRRRSRTRRTRVIHVKRDSDFRVVRLLAGTVERTKSEENMQAISKLQNKEDGSFAGDEWGEVDTRFSYCAFSALSLLTHGMGEECFLDWNLESLEIQRGDEKKR